MGGSFHATAALPPEKESLVPTEYGGTEIWSGRSGKQKNLLPLPRIGPPIVQLIT